MNSYQNHIYGRYNLLCLSYYSGDAHPSMIFAGVKYRLCINLAGANEFRSRLTYTSAYVRWYADERQNLFTALSYTKHISSEGFLRFAKVGSEVSENVLQKLLAKKRALGVYLLKSGIGHVNYHRSPVFWIRAMDFEPYFHSVTRERSLDHLKDLYLSEQRLANAVGAILNSTCF